MGRLRVPSEDVVGALKGEKHDFARFRVANGIAGRLDFSTVKTRIQCSFAEGSELAGRRERTQPGYCISTQELR